MALQIFLFLVMLWNGQVCAMTKWQQWRRHVVMSATSLGFGPAWGLFFKADWTRHSFVCLVLKIALLSVSRTLLGTNEIGCPWVKLCLEVVTLATSPHISTSVPLNQFDSFAHLHIIPLVQSTQSTHRDATDEA